MHSSPFLFPEQFPVRRPDSNGAQESLTDVIPDYHPQDRVAVVSQVWEDAYSQTGVAMTGFTALFYDAMRKTGRPFYIYPSHYLFMNHMDRQPVTRKGPVPLDSVSASWSQLDTWPETQWHFASLEIGDLLRMVFAQHIHRLFFPAELYVSSTPKEPLPKYMRWILTSRLKAVYIYGSSKANLRIENSPAGQEILDDGARRLEGVPSPTYSELEVIDSATFLEHLLGTGPKPPESGSE